jgi:signal transduction histidine kinase/ActR/RegA family two-component response regulator
MSSSDLDSSQDASGFHTRLDFQVAVAVTMVVAFAVTAALMIATRVVTTDSLDRASSDLAAARSAFYRLEDDRAEFAAAQAALVTTGPMFRAYMTDSAVASDVATMQVMVDEYRLQLKSAFCIVTGRDGVWIASSGWSHTVEPPASLRQIIAASATGRSGRDVAEIGNRLFLIVSEPARFAEETLGTLTVGYALDDQVAQQLAQVTHSEVNIVLGRHLAASSLTGDARAALASLVASEGSLSPADPGRTHRLASGEYFAGAFPLSPNGNLADTDRLVLLKDWAPTNRDLVQLRRQLFGAGAVIFLLALAGGLVFAWRVSRPLQDIASAAGDIAAGNWTRRVPLRGSAEATAMAGAFNAMTASLRHWYEEAKRRDDELRQTQKMEAIGRLAGGIAHDFNNLLTTIRGYGELVLLREQREESRSELKEILAAADRAADLTHQLLAFSRRQVITPGLLAVDQLVISTEHMLRRIIGEDIQLLTSIGQDLGSVRIDRSQMEQVLMNLVINARDAMPVGGKLRISVASVAVGAPLHDVVHSAVPQRYVCLSVADTGSGMDAETAARIFEPFYTTKEAGRGTGLGLAIVYGIVQDAGGMIDVETKIGRGTVFHVYLPEIIEAKPAEALAVNGEEATVAQTKASETVLLAEDDRRLRTLISSTLRNAGYTVLEGSDGEEALQIARARTAPIHLLLADVVMPGMNGRVLSDRVLSLRSETRVLFMSGYSDDQVTRHGIQTASSSYIRKPFSMDALTAKVRELLRSTELDSGTGPN